MSSIPVGKRKSDTSQSAGGFFLSVFCLSYRGIENRSFCYFFPPFLIRYRTQAAMHELRSASFSFIRCT